jgi:hypothetical protein
MSVKTSVVEIACLASLGLSMTAHARQQPGMSNMPGMSGTSMQGMNAMSANGMAGMDMPAMMKQCARMQQDMAVGKPMTPAMQPMMRQCDRMKGAMQAPAATEDR